MRILIAEDDLTTRTILEILLKKEGHEIEFAVNGDDAWAVMQRLEAPNMVILDWVMPRMDGLEVLKRVRARQTKKPPYILMVTVRDEKADIIAGLEAGANDYLLKPFDAGELRARVKVGQRMIEMQEQLNSKVEELRHALQDIRILRGIIPICSRCKKTRDDAGYRRRVETQIQARTEAEFSHGRCALCSKVVVS